MNLTLLILYTALAIGVSFLCSILEAVVLSIPNTQVAVWQKDGNRRGDLWSKLKADDAVKPLTAILTLNTIAHTMGAAGVGSEVQKQFGNEYLTVASIVLTLAVLFLSEIIPKTLGTAYWKQLSLITGIILNAITILLVFIIAPIQWMKKILPSADGQLVTRDDLAALADLGEEEGALMQDEETVILNLLRLREISVTEVMTPRVVVTALQQTMTIKEVLDEYPVLRFSRMPVYDESIDEIQGVVIRSELLVAASRDEWDRTIDSFMKPVEFLSTTQNVDNALDLFLERRQQFAVVQDEFGGTSGILTMEDVLETLLGEEIVDELDEVDDMRELAREQAALGEEE
ncbi:MAG: hemolysin [Euryarchaeota archaeon]|nr:hemolysin [Euryarchaeota archaeon]|tara:strand:+ start:188 stop:1222 length:1035 start_codon:yes stop_codon:yes gene_type:complete